MDPRSIRRTPGSNRRMEAPTRRIRDRREPEGLDVLLRLLEAPPGDEKSLLETALNHAVSLTRSRVGLLLEMDADLRVTRTVLSDEAQRLCAVPPDQLDGWIHTGAAWTRCLKTRRPAVFNHHDSGRTGLPVGHVPIDRLLAVPILDQARPVAVVLVGNKARPYDRRDARQLTFFLETVWILMARHRLEAGIRERDAMFRALAEQSVAGVGLIGPEGFRFANRALETLSGYTLAQVQGMGPLGFAQCLHPEDRAMVLERHVARIRGEPGLPDTYECRLLRPDGTARWVTLSANRVEVSGAPLIAIVVVDTHERHEAEEARKAALLQMREALYATVQTLGRVVEARDPYTAGHQHRVADLARALAVEMELGLDHQEAVRMAGLLHDVGKVAVPAEILAKPGRLTPTEMEIMRQHSRIGHDILEPVRFPWPIHRPVLQHHERMDGSGYPDGLRGAQIALESRILAVADMVEAMASHRPYRPALGIEAALEQLRTEQGRTLDARVVEACLRLFLEKGYRLP